MISHLANIITLSRMLGTLVFLFLDVYSPLFYLVYIWCGLSDILDGFVARKTKSVSVLGSKLDSASDLCFYTAMMIRILPDLKRKLPAYVFVLIWSAVGGRALCYLYVWFRDRVFQSRHTIYNKITGALMFFLPFLVKGPLILIYSLCILMVAFYSIGEEIFFIHHKKNV